MTAPHTTDKVGEALAREVLAQAYERANLTCPAADVRSGNKIDWVRENVALDAIAAALAPGQHDGAAGDVSDLLCRLADDAALSRERSVACRKIGDQRGWSIASQICDDIDEAVHVIRYLSARDGAAGEGCVGCEGKPAPENNPCAVCGAYTPKPSTEQARAEGYVLVPRVPTPEMIRAGEKAGWDGANSMPAIGAYARAWTAMLDATPSSDDGARR